MYPHKNIVHLQARDLERFTLPIRSWAKDQRGRTVCASCRWLKRKNIYPRSIDATLRQVYDGTSYDHIFRVGLGIIHQRLLSFLKLHMTAYVLGRAFWRDGSLMEDYRTIYFRDVFIVRGDRAATYHVCQECGLIGDACCENRYVLREDIPEGEVFQDRISCLYVCEKLARRLPWKSFPDIKPQFIPVRDKPLPDDPFPTVRRPSSMLT